MKQKTMTPQEKEQAWREAIAKTKTVVAQLYDSYEGDISKIKMWADKKTGKDLG